MPIKVRYKKPTRGYRVTVIWHLVSPEIANRIRQQIAKIMVTAVSRKVGK